MTSSLSTLLSAARESLTDDSFVKITLGHYKGDDDLKKITVKKVLIKREEKLSFTYTLKTRDIVKNFSINEGLQQVEAALKEGFHAATLFTTEFDLALDITKNKLHKSAPTITAAPSLAHDRAKTRQLDHKQSYLHALGITDANGTVLKSSQDKFRQIDKYVEILSTHLKNIKSPNIADMGAGKGYLTFALYDYLTTHQQNPIVTGVEIRPDMVALCNDIAAKSGFTNLHFKQGSIESYDASSANVLIALHACDTATDDAIAKGIAADAELIVVAPCCHKQIRRELESAKTQNDLEFLTRHGIFMERSAEMVTDGLRALILEYFGYTVKVMEFISTEHTPKNILIIGTKNAKAKPRDPAILAKIHAAKAYFGIRQHYLEQATKL